MKSGCSSKETKQKRSIKLPVLKSSSAQNEVIRDSRTSRWRAAALITLTALMVIHVVQWWATGRTVSPIEPSETRFTLQSGAVNAGFIFFTLAILATLIFGRFVCGWACHIVALQDFCAWLLKKAGLKPRPFRSRLLVFVPLAAALYMFVWPTVYAYFAGPPEQKLFPSFSNHLITTTFWATFPTVAVAIPFLFICGFVTVYFLGQKGFCTYACPYGGFFAVADKFAPGKIRVTDACNQCGHCTATCTSNVLVHAEVKQYGMVVDPGCMKCMDCISVCPNDALYFGFGKPAVGIKPAIKRNYTLTWPEEIAAAVIFVAGYFSVWDAYQLVPMLMALGIAAVTAYLALRAWRVLRATDLTFYRFTLKSAGRMRAAGWVFLAFASLWLGLTAHSGWVHYHESAGTAAYQNIQIPDELALAQPNPAQWLTAADKANVALSKSHFHQAVDRGLFVNTDARSKLAWLDYLSGDPDRAVHRLAALAERQDGQSRALSLYYRGAMLNRAGHFADALASLDQALVAAPDLVLAREERGESLWQLGRKDDAIAAWAGAVKANPGLVVASQMLAGAALTKGQTDVSAAWEKQADRNTPQDPYFQWMVGQRLQNLGMNMLAEKHFQQAIQLDPSFSSRRPATAVPAQ